MALSKNDPKVIEASYNVLEKIITAIEFQTKEELIKLANIMVEKVEAGDYPEILKLAYADAKRKVELLSLEQIMEIKGIINS